MAELQNGESFEAALELADADTHVLFEGITLNNTQSVFRLMPGILARMDWVPVGRGRDLQLKEPVRRSE